MSNPANAKSKSGMTGILRKFISGFTGIVWVLFVIVHLIGNLSLFSKDGTAFNKYAHFLESTGVLLYVAEASLIIFLLMHVVSGVQVWLGKRKARPEAYKFYQSAGAKSKQSLASRSMIISGSLLLVFLVMHVATFKFNVHLTEIPMTAIKGIDGQIRDLHQIVWDAFSNPIAAFAYTAIMLFLGLHLRHGVWSALQSIGAMKPKYSPVIYTIAGLLAALVAVGFLSIPLYIYFSSL